MEDLKVSLTQYNEQVCLIPLVWITAIFIILIDVDHTLILIQLFCF